MTPEQRAEAVRAVMKYRAAAARMRRNAMRRTNPEASAHARNEQVRIEALKTLCRLGLAEVADALEVCDQQRRKIANAKRAGHDLRVVAQQAQLYAAERMIREALAVSD